MGLVNFLYINNTIEGTSMTSAGIAFLITDFINLVWTGFVIFKVPFYEI